MWEAVTKHSGAAAKRSVKEVRISVHVQSLSVRCVCECVRVCSGLKRSLPGYLVPSQHYSSENWPQVGRIDEKVTRWVPDTSRECAVGGKLSRVTWNFPPAPEVGESKRKIKIPASPRFCRKVHRCSSHIAARNALMMRMVGPVRDSDQPTARPSSKKGNATIFSLRLILLLSSVYRLTPNGAFSANFSHFDEKKSTDESSDTETVKC